MASRCFYLILHSVLFIVTVFVVQVFCDSAGHYHIQNAHSNNFDATFVPLEIRVKRQLSHTEKKPEEPVEDKSKTTKKPTSLDVKPVNISQTEKPRGSVNKKELSTVKAINATAIPSEPSHAVLEQNGDGHLPRLSQANSSSTSAKESTSTSFPATASNKSLSISTTETTLTNLSVPDLDIQITKMLDSNISVLLKQHNITQERQDYHVYYNSSLVVDPEVGQRYWVDLDKHSDAKVCEMLSKSYRRATTIKLSFDFPFYGHLIRNITIATGGFLYTGDYVHSWLAATQYIAPLMANFDTLSNSSFIKYLDNGTAFTVQWENVILRDRPDKGGFTFQCTLHKNGNIVFVYQQVAVVIEDIQDEHHPLKIGLSDAYIIDRTIFFVRRKTIYEYHRVNFQKQDIKNWTVIVLNALDTCLDMKDCHSCLTQLKNFKCNWCANRCSNGMDRHRQDWITNGCEKAGLKPVEECSMEEAEQMEKTPSPFVQGNHKEESVIGVAGIMGILFLICLSLGIGMWFFYAYRNPHTPAGQFLIRYRPSQWSWRRGEARYTAATIHM